MENFFVLMASVLACALLVVAVLKTMDLPVVPAYFIAGMVMGPGGLGLLESGEEADFVAELGIILLLFTVGLQFNLAALKSLRTFVFALGGIQAFATAAVVACLARFYTDGWLLASLIGFVAMLSPTAVIGQILLQENAVNSPVGRRAVGVLLFQDFLTIPLIIIYSSGGDVSLWTTAPLVGIKIAAVLGVVFFAAPRVVKTWLDWTAVRGDKELFVLSIVALIAASALATGILELTYVLGPFLAGILIAETAHRENVEHMMEPFRHLLMGFFFIAVGMLIDVRFFLDNLGKIAALAAAMWAIKVPLMYCAVRVVKSHNATALRTAFLMGGGGPFGFVLLAVAKESGVIPPDLFQLLVPANILALVATPFVWARTDKIVNFLCPDDISVSTRKTAENAAKADKMQNHAVICGFGRTGQSIAGILRGVPMDFVGIDSNHLIIETVGDAEPVIYGEGHETETLVAAGIRRAAILNITVAEPLIAAAVARTARKLNPDIHIIAKASNPRQAQDLQESGADQTLVAAHQCGMSMAGQTLRRYPEISQEKLAVLFKKARYRDNPLFQGEYLGTGYTQTGGKCFVGCVVRKGGDGVQSAAAGQGISIVQWQRGENLLDPAGDSPLQIGDKLILMGAPRELRKAKARLSGD
ncbi:MAG: hypothetical protein HAW59_03120 [Betaproteobacteria bacterium]|nr:hypothetical protein [Betaproteobacteria bacterium]